MPRKPCYWTRKLELELVSFVRARDYIWRPLGNTNHHIQQKYKAYAEFAAKQGRGFTARSVRDRWVNIRSTFNHNLRRVEQSKLKTPDDVYVPCWPLWKPLQFLREVYKKEDLNYETYQSVPQDSKELTDCFNVKEEQYESENDLELNIRQRGQRTDRPRRKSNILRKSIKKSKCKKVIDDLLNAVKPFAAEQQPEQSYWFFGKHVTERLNCMRKDDAESACREIMKLLSQRQLGAT